MIKGIKTIGASVLISASIVGSLFCVGQMATANATPIVDVCIGIDNVLAGGGDYVDYFIAAGQLGYEAGYSQKQQGQNIADSVIVYCPEHLQGMLDAAEYISNS